MRRRGRADEQGLATSASGVGLRAGVKAALMRWVLQKRRGLQVDSRPSARDEATHEWDGRRRFAEDYTFAAVQDELALLVRLEWLAGRDAHRLWVVVLRADGTAWRLDQGDDFVPGGVGDRWRVGGMTLDCLRPHREWSLRYHGRVVDQRGRAARVEIDATFTSELDPYVPGVDDDPDLIARRLGEAQWDAALVRMVRRATQRGYVQVGGLAGTLALGDELVPIRADTLRQHTWGVRDWGATRRAEQWFVAWPDGARSWVHRAEFPAFTLEGGFVLDGSRAAPVSSVAIDSSEPEPGVPTRASVAVERTPAGPRLAFTTETRAQVTFPVDGRGALSVGLVRVSDGGIGLWAAQRRTLPWPAAR
ncbi:MAG TPA: hypothetical protein VFG69_00435 [Nannocystaceae bacterium]|nr:hypothetical protein [Nannocystaceae bacterium]